MFSKEMHSTPLLELNDTLRVLVSNNIILFVCKKTTGHLFIWRFFHHCKACSSAAVQVQSSVSMLCCELL